MYRAQHLVSVFAAVTDFPYTTYNEIQPVRPACSCPIVSGIVRRVDCFSVGASLKSHWADIQALHILGLVRRTSEHGVYLNQALVCRPPRRIRSALYTYCLDMSAGLPRQYLITCGRTPTVLPHVCLSSHA